MQATAVGYQSVDRWSVHTRKGRKEEAGEEARANVERTLRQGGGRRRRRERGSSEKDGRGFFICIVGTRHIQFARSSKIAGLVRRSDREVRRKRNKVSPSLVSIVDNNPFDTVRIPSNSQRSIPSVPNKFGRSKNRIFVSINSISPIFPFHANKNLFIFVEKGDGL